MKNCAYINKSCLPALLLAALLGCGRSASLDQAVIVHKGGPLSLTPHLRAELITVSVQSNIFESLVEFDPDMNIRPLLAERWENPDDLTWVFKLRPGVKFHDGAPLTADDVVYSLKRVKNYPASGFKADFLSVDSIAKVDENTVKITTRRPCPFLLNRLVYAMIVPKAAMERLGDEEFSKRPVGTGPYRFASFTGAGPLVLEAFDGYWGRKPDFRRLNILSRMETEQSLKLMSSGDADIVTKVDVNSALKHRIAPGAHFSIVSQPGLTLRYLGYNCRVRPFNNILVRKAINISVDRSKLINEYNKGFGQPANQLVPPAVFGYNPLLPRLSHEPEHARQLLARAGYPKGIDLALTVPETFGGLGRQIKTQMEAAGIRVTLSILSREDMFKAIDTLSFFLFGVSSATGDASDLLGDAIHSRTKGYGGTNRGNYENHAIDRLIENSMDFSDPQRCQTALQEIMALCMEDLPRAPLLVEDEIYGVADRIKWQPRLDMMVLGKEIHKARVDSTQF